MSASLDECRLLSVPRFADSRGSLSALEGASLLPFQPKRFYYLYDTSPDAHRGRHAHKFEQELILALAGSFTISVTDGTSSKVFELARPDRAVYVPALIWHELSNFAPGSVCAVLASERYNPNDEYREFEEFLRARRQ